MEKKEEKEPMTSLNQIPVSKELEEKIDEAAKAGRIIFEPGWNTPKVQEKYRN